MTTPTNLNLIWALTGGSTNPGDAKYSTGWEVEIPTYQDFNHVLRSLDEAKLSYAEADVYLWQDLIAYAAGAKVKKGGVTYRCVTSHNDSVGSNPQDPSLDTTNSYWVVGSVFSTLADSYSNLRAVEGLKLDKVQTRPTNDLWNSNDVTINNISNIIALNNDSASYDNLLFGNVRGKLVVINVANLTDPDGRNLISDTSSYNIYHEGNKPTQGDIDGTIPTEPQDGKLYGRRANNWVEVTTTTISEAPPPPVSGNGQSWYNLEDGRLYVDINDGDSSQWVPASPPIIPELVASNIVYEDNENIGKTTVQSALDYMASQPALTYISNRQYPTVSNGADSDHDIVFSSGKIEDSTGTFPIVTRELTKQADAAWVAGTNVGGLFSGSMTPNTTYHLFFIVRDSDGVVDAGFDTDSEAANIPAGYTTYRRIASLVTDVNANLRKFTQRGNFFEYVVEAANLGGRPTLVTGVAVVEKVSALPHGLTNLLGIVGATVFYSGTSTVLIQMVSEFTEISSLVNYAASIHNGFSFNSIKATLPLGVDPSVQFYSTFTNGGMNISVSALGWIDDRG